MRQGLLLRYRRIDRIRRNPHVLQEKLRKYLIHKGKETKYGNLFSFQNISSLTEYKKSVPLVQYDDIKPYIKNMTNGERDVLWPGKTNWFAKSSGTTAEKSKYIPVTKEKLYQSHISTNWDVLSVLYKQHPRASIFSRKGLIMTGSIDSLGNAGAICGDISAIMLYNIPKVARPFYTPSIEIGLMQDWEEKIDLMSTLCPSEDVGMLGGVPTWTLVMLKKLLKVTGKDNILDVWPNLNVYFHGGVGFAPYRSVFNSIMPTKDVFYLEAYNASEGYFAVQDRHGAEDMLLMLDNGVYYEFLPLVELGGKEPVTVGLEEVELGIQYALVISTTAGLWRYIVGDTIQFTELHPYRIQVTGRISHYINTFGEEVMISNTDKAIADTCKEMNTQIADYTVAPIFTTSDRTGGHEWVIEFDKEPNDMEEFANRLDLNLQDINSDYEAKRFKNMAMDRLKINSAPKGTFHNWMRLKGKMGGQHKIPRLFNSRMYIDELLTFIK